MILGKQNGRVRLSHDIPTWRDVDWCYHQACAAQSDIHEHLPVLRALAEGRVVVEFGVRAVVSTWAFLAARPLRLTSVDITPHPNVEVAQRVADAALVPFSFICSDTLQLPQVYCDLLFIDTLHTHDQLLAELFRHSEGVGDLIALHDTETFGDRGEDGQKPGLRAAVDQWRATSDGQRWDVLLDLPNCNGLMVLRRQKNP